MSTRDEDEPFGSGHSRPSGEAGSQFADVHFSNQGRSSQWPRLALATSLLVSTLSAVIGVVALVYSLRPLPPIPMLTPLPVESKRDLGDNMAPLVKKLGDSMGELVIALKDAHVSPRSVTPPETSLPPLDGDTIPARQGGTTPSGGPGTPIEPTASPTTPAVEAPRDDTSKAVGRLAGRLESLQVSTNDAFAQQASRIDRLIEVFGQPGDLATPRDLVVIAFNSKSLPFASYREAYEDVFIDKPLQQRYKGQRVGLWVAVTQDYQEIIPLTWQESKLEEFRSRIRATSTGLITTDRPDEIVGKLAQKVFESAPTRTDATALKPIPRRCVFVVAADCRAPNLTPMAKGDPEIDVILVDSGNAKVEELPRWVEFSASRNGVLRLIRLASPPPPAPPPPPQVVVPSVAPAVRPGTAPAPTGVSTATNPKVADLPPPSTTTPASAATAAGPASTANVAGTQTSAKPPVNGTPNPVEVAKPKVDVADGAGRPKTDSIAPVEPPAGPVAAVAEAPSPHPRLVEPLKKELRRLTQPLLERR